MKERTVILEDTLKALVESKKYTTLRDILVTMNPTDIAAVFEEMPEGTLPRLFRLLPKESAADTFVEMESDCQELLIRGFSDSELKSIVDELYVDDAVDLIEEMPANVVTRILNQANPETRKMINTILRYPEDSAGSIMTTEYVALKPEMSVADAISHIRRVGCDKETVNACYVIDHQRHLIGMVTIRDLILATDETVIGDIMEDNLIYVTTHEDQETVAQIFSKYNFISLPVVDTEDRMLGIVTVDDAMDVMEDEVTEDVEKMAAIVPTDPGKTYLRTSVGSIWKSRIPWLLFLMLSSTFTGMIITGFESALAVQTALVAYIPMLMGTGGNSGSQASVTVIRGLSLDEIRFRDTAEVLWKETRVSVLCGLALAICCFAKIWFIDRMLLGNSEITMMVDLVVCLALFATVVFSKLIGCVLPLLAEKLHLDPAVMASPIITTLVDALALLVYFLIACAILPM